MSRIGKSIETASRLVLPVSGGGGAEGIGRDSKQVQDFFLEQWKCSGISGNGYTTL